MDEKMQEILKAQARLFVVSDTLKNLVTLGIFEVIPYISELEYNKLPEELKEVGDYLNVLAGCNPLNLDDVTIKFITCVVFKERLV